MLEKLRGAVPARRRRSVLDTDSEGDTVVIGPNEDYRKELLGDGGLGDNDVFKDVVREADDASWSSSSTSTSSRTLVDGGRWREDDRGARPTTSKPLLRASGSRRLRSRTTTVAHAVLRLTTD